MDDKYLLAGALTLSAIGIMGLLVALQLVPPDSWETAPDGMVATLEGRVVQIDGAAPARIRVAYEATATIVSFEEVAVREGMCVRARGKVETWKGQRELALTRLEEIPC